MDFINEFEFLSKILDKNRLRYLRIAEKELTAGRISEELGAFPEVGEIVIESLGELMPRTLYRLSDPYGCAFRLMLLSSGEEREMLIVGPFLSEHVSAKKVDEILGVTEPLTERSAYFYEYFRALPHLTEGEGVLSVIEAFCELVWQVGGVKSRDLVGREREAESHGSRKMLDVTPEDTLVTMKAIERRYEFENELIRAVSSGKSDLEVHFAENFDESLFEKRSNKPLRNGQNYSIIMNTLLRKAAERGGVHPIYLDRISSEYAKRIEELSDVREIVGFMKEMFLGYCRLVRRESTKNLTPIVKEAVHLIEADLSSDISPSKLASALGVSLGYLSGIFKRDTGKTLSRYIRDRRMEYAEYLIGNTELQIQAVALRCGIVDVQYFSKLFKGSFGKTPSEYREEKRGFKG